MTDANEYSIYIPHSPHLLGYDLKPMFSLQRSLPPWLRHKPKLLNTLYGGLVVISALVLLRIAASSLGSTPSFSLPEADRHVTSSEWNSRAERVKEAFVHAYHGYEKYASPEDELRPVTNEGMSGYNGWGATAFDSLDTMLLMGLQDEYERALKVVKAANFNVSRFAGGHVPYFETVIRYLGGLLSAYALSNDTTLLQRAENLADAIDPVFETPSGLAAFGVNPITHKQYNLGMHVLAEFASFQVEYTYLAKVSGKKKYMDRVNKLHEIFRKTDLQGSGGMLATFWDTAGHPKDSRNKVSVGAQADSTHEYLLKQFLLTGKTDKFNLELYLKATAYIITNMLYLSPKRGLLYVTDTAVPLWTDSLAGSPSHVFEHLSCFFPGLLALGAHTLPLNDLESLGINLSSLFTGGTSEIYSTLKGYDLKQLHLWAAEGLAQTCWLTYADQPSGLGPDEVMMLAPASSREWDPQLERWRQVGESYLWINAMDKWKKSGGRGPMPGVSDKPPVIWTEEDREAKKPNHRDYHVRKTGYLLRPETVESFYLLWRATGDVKWRNRGWTVFEAIEREARTDSGYVTLKNVKTKPAVRGNSMPSFFLAETLKYLYLLFKEDDILPLDQWVFNTEAHPVPVFEWTAEERQRFNIA
ncbi:hypothetical protein EST38_g2818 [Candolleomyces aberdarensis]|uniref:alpha-1,2-Mannosidase n=1 Tax=Candolleomyces aberdarensis TaxID=2316362 RepID=A0A4Q2DV84_9AGAR|nr:hypothetical protein EST38_g2818 [Candolleomyces aberdarensis]